MGDSDTGYTMQSTSKPFNYAIAHEILGDDLHEFVGREPSGHKFNKILLDRKGRPHNPMINMGAIMTASLIERNEPVSSRYNVFKEKYDMLLGGRKKTTSDVSVYKSELEVGFKNKSAINYMMDRKCWKGLIESEQQLQENLELYYFLCSIQVTTEEQAEMSAVLANRGIHPITQQKCLDPISVRNTCSLMLSSGMYDYSGEFNFKYGVPAKSGVSGAITIVVPDALALTVYSPWLSLDTDSSALGMEFIARFINDHNCHIFEKRDEFQV